MKKKTKNFLRVLCSLLVCAFGFLGVGCGSDSDHAPSLKEAYENGEISFEEYQQLRLDSQMVPLHGTKILYRPDHYDWDNNVGDGNQEYFGQYSWNLLKQLMAIYGIVDQDAQTDIDPITNKKRNPSIFPTDPNKLSGFYDSIRYQMSSYNNITLNKINLTDSSKNDSVEYFEVTANTNKKWKWNFGLNTNYNYTYTEYLQNPETKNYHATDKTMELKIENSTYIYNQDIPDILKLEFVDTNGNKIKFPSISLSNPIQNNFLTQNNYINNIKAFYDDSQNSYSNIYLGTGYSNGQQQTLNYSDYVKALEYAIYCINLDLTPNSMSVSYNTKDGVSDKPVVTIAGYPATADKSSVDVALDFIKDLFAKRGTFVGMNDRQQTRLKNWIFDNIIGENSDSTYKITQENKVLIQYVKMKQATTDVNGDGNIDALDQIEVMCDKDGNETNTFAPIQDTGASIVDPPIEVERNYVNTIDKIVETCTKLVNIGVTSTEGEEGAGDLNIDKKYLASNIIDYYGNDFFVSGNSEFPKGPSGEPEALEYQSIILMPRQEINFSNIILYFAYDGSDEIEGNEEIEIQVFMNYYTHADRYYRPAYLIEGNEKNEEFAIKVTDTAFNYGSKENTMLLLGINNTNLDGSISGITLNAWEKDYKNGILNSIDDGYTGLTSIGTPLPLTGLSNLRNYYKMKNDSFEDNGETYSYTYGEFDPEVFDADGDGCDFFELSFKVLKVTSASDFATKNYKFYLGFGLVG